MLELAPEEYARVRPLLPRGFGMAAAVLAGRAPGRVWADDAARPTRALVGTAELWLLLGMPRDDGFDDDLRALLADVVFAGGSVRAGDDELLLSVHPPSWEARLPRLFGARRYLPDPRAYLELAPGALVPQPPPAGYSLVEVDGAFLERGELANHSTLTRWIDGHFLDRADFLERGAATCLVAGGEVASLCVTDCAGGGVAEVGVETAPGHRRRGLGAAVVAATCARLSGRGVERVGWHCWRRNEASLRTAARVGFRKAFEYGSWFAMFDPVRDRLVHGWWYLTVRDDPRAAAEELRPVLAEAGETVEPAWFVHAARAEARLGDDERAFVYLRRARDLGWDGLEGLSEDADFERLRSDPAWELLN